MSESINTYSVDRLINEFRQISQKDGITPENVGALLSAITSCISQAPTSASVDRERDVVKRIAQVKLLDNSQNLVIANISTYIKHGWLYVDGAEELIKNGYRPYIFRYVAKRNRRIKNGQKVHSEARSGWALFGSVHTSGATLDGGISFCTLEHKKLGTPLKYIENSEELDYLPDPSILIGEEKIDSKGRRYLPWSKNKILLVNKFGTQKQVKLRFAIAFGLPVEPAWQRVNVKDMVTNLAEFTIVYNSRVRSAWFAR